MRNRVRQSRTLGSVRGGARAVMENLHGHVAGNGGHGQGDTYGSGGASPTRRRKPLAKKGGRGGAMELDALFF
jgi:hypothetical protein